MNKYLNLKKISKINEVNIPTSYTFYIKEWRENKFKIIKNIQNEFSDFVAIRSCYSSEDQLEQSLAGVFNSYLNIDILDTEKVISRVEKVIKSYKNFTEESIENEIILVQEMITNIKSSGVILTYDTKLNSPYYILNIDEISKSTDSITSGVCKEDITQYVLKNRKFTDYEYQELITICEQIEIFMNNNKLDIEFCITDESVIYILQVRPLVNSASLNSLDTNILNENIALLQKYLNSKSPFLFGNKTCLSDMSDWNPAEMIGVRPSTLSFTLYENLITNEEWREAREYLGYYNPKNTKLMISVLGHPYIDLRVDLNSLLPKDIQFTLFNKLIDYYINKLIRNPNNHDKIEFNIVDSCLTFNFERRRIDYYKNNFSMSEIESFEKSLLRLTNNMVGNFESISFELEDKVELMKKNLKKYDSINDIPNLLMDTKKLGIFSFSVVVRMAFVAMDILKSMLENQIIDRKAYDSILGSVKSVSYDFNSDLRKVEENILSREVFLEKYGHLRPNMYDITSSNYKEIVNLNFKNNICDKIVESNLKESDIDNINRKFRKIGYTFDFDKYIKFLRDSFYKRELYKFEFSKNINKIFEVIQGEFPTLHNEDLQYIDISCLINEEVSEEKLKENIKINKKISNSYKSFRTPDFISSVKDITIVKESTKKPNFITNKKIKGEVIFLGKNSLKEAISNKIVIIDNADPGYEWIFSQNIKGLITKYGGAASHMSLRCSELSIPAAIGCGEKIFKNILEQKIVEIHADTEKIIY